METECWNEILSLKTQFTTKTQRKLESIEYDIEKGKRLNTARISKEEVKEKGSRVLVLYTDFLAVEQKRWKQWINELVATSKTDGIMLLEYLLELRIMKELKFEEEFIIWLTEKHFNTKFAGGI
jgi:hypothetical protein